MALPSGEKLVLNKNNSCAKKLMGMDSESDNAKLAAQFIYDVAKLTHSQLDGVAMDGFVARSNAVLEGFIK